MAASLDPFRDPRSVAVVGASDNPAKWGYWLARGALTGQGRRTVYLVNRGAEAIQGHRTFAGVADLPEAPHLLVLCVPASEVEAVVAEALTLGVRAFLGITAGVPDQARIGATIRAAGGRIVGPNSLGIYDAATGLALVWGHFTPGPLAIVSQSGQLGSEIAALAARAGLGVSRFVSVGNQLDVKAAELLEDLLDHDATRLVALYLESFADGADLVRTLRSLRDAGKMTIVLTTGASAGSRRLARSHTGSLTSALDVVDAACRAAGAVRVCTPQELVDLARYLDVAPTPRGRRVAVISDSGGQGGIAADLAATHGLSLPVFSAGLQTRLAAALPAGASVANPVDLAGAGEADLYAYADIGDLILASGEVDAVVLSGYLGCYGEDTPSIEDVELAVVDRMGAAADGSHVPVLVHSMSAGSRAVRRLWENGIPTYPGIEPAIRALSGAAHLADWPGREIKTLSGDPAPVRTGYLAACDLLTDAGIATPRGVAVQGPDDVARAADELSFPLVLKAGWFEHKSEHGAVELGLTSAAELAAAYERMRARLGPGQYVVEEQDVRPDAVEVLVSGRRDRDFGPVVVVGAGGTETELRRDVCLELAPVDTAVAASMIRRLACLPLLEGWRGRPAVDLASLASVVVAASEAIAVRSPLQELEINPVRVSPLGALAVDALVLTTADSTHREERP